MILNIITINRPGKDYLHKTIESLYASDWHDTPVHLIVGNEDESHVEAYQQCFNVVKWDKETKRPQVDFCLNYIRALRHQPDDDVVICEDDIEFGKTWLARLSQAVGEIPFSRYVLSLYSANDLSNPSLRRGQHYRLYPSWYFYGTQAIYYPAGVRLEIAKYIEDNIERKPGDVLIGEWCVKHRCLYSAQGSLVQHVGVCSTGLAAFHHTAWNYTPDGVAAPIVCRHRAEAVSPEVHRCTSPKLVGLKLVTDSICRSCHYRNHELNGSTACGEVRLLPCLRLGQVVDGEQWTVDCGEAVYNCMHPAHPRTTAVQCQSCPDYLFPVITELTPATVVQEMLDLPPHPQADGWWAWPNVHEALRLGATDAIAKASAYPGEYDGRGIVIVGGGKYFVSAYVTARVLRHVGCRLPIQLWHWAGELTEPMRQALSPFGVACVDADQVARRQPFRILHDHWWKGFQLKPYAIVHSPFREVLLLDADCYPTRDPEFLFDWPAYGQRGAVFWPDLVSSKSYLPEAAWEIFGTEPGGPPLELGQLLIDKEACWAPLQLTLWYNAHADLIYKILWGDKDTFNIAWSRLGRRFSMPGKPAAWDTHTILQHGPDGEVLFQHRCRDKFRLNDESFSSTPQSFKGNHYNPRLAHEGLCFAFLDELRQAWKLVKDSCVR